MRLEKEGIDEFEPHEVLEFLLYYVDQRGDKNPVAHDLLERFGSLEDVLAADEHVLRGVGGVGSRGAFWLKHIWAMTRSYAWLGGGGRPRLSTLREVREFTGQYLLDDEPGVWQLCLTRGNRLLLSTRLGSGSAWGESVAMCDALSDVLGVHASAVVLAQCLPFGPLEIDEYDVSHTRAYARTLAAVGVRLLDHVLVSARGSLSLAFSGCKIDPEEPEDYLEAYLAEV